MQRNPVLICAHHALSMALVPVAVITLIWRDSLGLDMAQIMGLQAIFAATVALLEFPSGYLADRIGYRRTLLLASWVAVGGWSIYAASTGFWSTVAAEVVMGAAISLVSGADLAMLYESLRATEREPEFSRWAGWYGGAGQVSEALAALAAGLLFALSPRLPFYVQVALAGINVVIALELIETPREPRTGVSARERLRGIVALATRRGPLRAILALSLGLALASFIPVWLIQLYALDAGVPVQWLGPIWAAANLSVALGSLASARVGGRFGLMPTLLACIGLIALGYAGLALSFALGGFAFYFCLTFMRGLWFPILNHEEQRLIPSGDRAALLSLRSFLFRGSFVAIGPAVGWWVDRSGQHRVLAVVGCLVTALCLAAWLWLARVRSSARLAAPIDAA
jgi:MFS family permease